ncbi:MAG: trypsin-like peptidase domain-containing protein, partial [Planctomycetes bacterium]|nr:trypsin-like peptidase domain-containing protein [Planctomycetota bacterium]
MAVRITCSSCKSQFTVSDDKRGRKVRCRECEKPIVVPDADAPKKKRDPEEAIQKDRKVRMAADRRSSDDDDDDDDDRPTRKKAAAAKKPVPMMLVVGGIVAVLLLCVVGVGGVAVFGIGGLGVFTLRANKEVENQAQANPKNDGPNVNLLDGKKPPIDPDAGKALPAELPPELVPKLKEATVYLRVTMPSGQVAEGSGFLAVEPGIVITNAHVLGMLGAKSEPPRNVQVVLNSGLPNERMILGDVLGVDRASDLAVVHIKDGNLPAPLQLEMSRQLVETQKVYIFGFPFGEQLGKNITVSASTISSFRTDPSTRELEQIQVNGGMHPGNSGGPVVHAGGKLVGVSVAGIRGTQINFAIPAEKVRLIMDGRLADAKHGEVYMQGAQTMLPVQFNCLDPLNRVRKMHVEVWAGTPGPPRPYSLKQPQAQAGDGKRQAHPMAYQNFGGALDVPMPPLEVGQVCWVQPVITTASGTTHWGNAVPTSVGMVPLERKDADLKVSLTAVTERTVILKNSSSVTIFMGKKKKMIAEVLEGEILESLSFHQKCAFIKTGIGGFNVRAEEDGRAIPLNPEIPPYLRAIPPQFILDETNKLRGRLDRSLGKTKMSPILREQVEDYYSQLCNALEAVNIPMPNRVIRPLESFPTQLPMMLESGKKPEIADLMLTCTYEGVRTRNQRS